MDTVGLIHERDKLERELIKQIEKNVEQQDKIRELKDEILLLKGCIDYINPTKESVNHLIEDYKGYVESFNR